ncbi:MAG: histone H1 [Deltaproteobacteria bacterium]|nr:histone H1 [Deltaproteobacteria bacterium]
MKHRPADVDQLGKLIADIAVGDVEDNEPKSDRARGGHARAATMTPEQRKEIATKAASARWKRKVAADTAQ